MSRRTLGTMVIACAAALIFAGSTARAAADDADLVVGFTAAGEVGGEVVALFVGGVVIAEETLTATPQDFSHLTGATGQVEVRFVSSPEPVNPRVTIDAVAIGGIAYESEDPSTETLANGTACAEGYLETELLTCPGSSLLWAEPLVGYLATEDPPLETLDCGAAPELDGVVPMFGAWIHESGDPGVTGEVDAAEALVGADFDYIRRFTKWYPTAAQVFPRPEDFDNRDNGRLLHLSIKPAHSWAMIASAEPGSALYAEMYAWARTVCEFGAPMYLTFHHEPEGAGDRATYGEPDEFSAAFSAMHDVFDTHDVDNVAWVWVMSWYSFSIDDPTDPRDPDLYYPGPAVTDVIGFDPYNFFDCTNSDWDTWDDVSQPFLDWLALSAPTKPVMIPELGSLADPNDPGRRAEWLAEATADLNTSDWDNLLGVAYFNRDGSFGDGCDWNLDDDAAALDEWRLMAESARFNTPIPLRNPECDGMAATIVWGPDASATSGDDVIVGTAGVDSIDGRGGDDVICAFGGDDIINGGSGDDVILGGDGDDTIGGQGGDDLLSGEDGADLIHGGTGADTILGGEGDDDLRGQGDDDEIHGDGGVDQIFGGSGNDTIMTGDGGNLGSGRVVRGQGNNDMITGGGADDALEGGSGLDQLFGGAGNDFLAGGPGNDQLLGEGGDDTLTGQGGGADVCDGGVIAELGGDTATTSCEIVSDVP